MNLTKIFYSAIYVLFILGTLVTVGNVGQYIDIPSFLVVFVIALLFAVSAKGEESIIKKVGNGAVQAGWLCLIIGIIAVFNRDCFASGYMSEIALTVCSLSVF